MHKYFPIFDEAVSHIWICNCSILNFLIYEEHFDFLFISAEFNLLEDRQVGWSLCNCRIGGWGGGGGRQPLLVLIPASHNLPPSPSSNLARRRGGWHIVLVLFAPPPTHFMKKAPVLASWELNPPPEDRGPLSSVTISRQNISATSSNSAASTIVKNTFVAKLTFVSKYEI